MLSGEYTESIGLRRFKKLGVLDSRPLASDKNRPSVNQLYTTGGGI